MINTVFLIYPKEQTLLPWLGVLYIATALKKGGISIKVIDCVKENLDDTTLFLILSKIKPKNICLSTMTAQARSHKRLVEKLRCLLPEIKIILGGVHATAYPQNTFLEITPDVLVKGEGEEIILPIIRALNLGQEAQLSLLPGIIFRDRNNNVIETPGMNRIQDLNTLSIPDWSLLPPNEYDPKQTLIPLTMQNGLSPRAAYLQTSRGCKYNCPFCASKGVLGKNIRYRSTQHVLDEIKMLTAEYNIKRLCIIDDNFVNDKKHAYNICKAIIDNKIEIKWELPNGIKIQDIDDTLIEIFVKSGLYFVGFGIETLDLSVQKKNRKIINIDQAKKTVNKLRANNIKTCCFIIVGLPGETKTSIENTLNEIQKISFDYIRASLFVPLPGSEYFYQFFPKQKEEEGLFSFVAKSYCALSISELEYYRQQFILIGN